MKILSVKDPAFRKYGRVITNVNFTELVEEIAEKFVKVTGTVEPDPELVAKYEDRYQKFRQIYPACRPLFEIIK